MKWLLTGIWLVALLATNVSAETSTSPYSVIFAQEVTALRTDGTPYPSMTINPGTIAGMQHYLFDLGQGRQLVIESNIRNAKERGLFTVADVVKRCYQYVEAASGGTLKKGVLLYLIEFDELPFSYSFEASYSAEANWSEVRLALIRTGDALVGPGASTELTDLLYDTLPHELGHDILGELPALRHDIDGRPSYHTRWFIDGVCELLAKGFSRQENPQLLQRLLAMRNIDSVMERDRIRDQVFVWEQNNSHAMDIESDLYGAAMLLMTVWTEQVPLDVLIGQIREQVLPLDGDALRAMLEVVSGCDVNGICLLADRAGKQLTRETILASRLEQSSGGENKKTL